MKKLILGFCTFLSLGLSSCSEKSETNTPPNPNPNQSKFTEANRASFIRPFDGSSVKVLSDLWEIRMNLGSDINYYNERLTDAEKPGNSWLENNNAPFFHAMEGIMGYPLNGFWKYKPYINAVIPDTILSRTYEVANNASGRQFVHELENNCNFHEIQVGGEFQSAIREALEDLNPCVVGIYDNAWVDYDNAAGNDTDDQLALNVSYNDSPFIFKGPVGGTMVLHPLSNILMSPRTREEQDYIVYLQKKIADSFQLYMNNPANVSDNPRLGLNTLIPPLNTTFLLNNTYVLNAKLDKDYVSSRNSSGSVFVAEYLFQRNLMNSVLTAIENGNEDNFITAVVKLAASHPVQSQRKTVLEAFPDLFITKDFPTYQVFTSYMHFLLNCTEFH